MNMIFKRGTKHNKTGTRRGGRIGRLAGSLTNKGFTLVELFLTVSLFGIILVTIFSTYASGIRIWKTVKSVELIESRKLILTMEKIRREMLGYVRNSKEVLFKGDDESVSFPYLGTSAIVEVTYYYDKGEDALMRKAVIISESLKEKMDERETKLFDARDVEFSYLYAPKDPGGIEFETPSSLLGGWVSSFEEEKNGIPKAVKLDIKPEGKEDRIEQIIFFPE